MNPMVDGWMGGDWFHLGAFREQNRAIHYSKWRGRDNSIIVVVSYHDDYDLFLQAG